MGTPPLVFQAHFYSHLAGLVLRSKSMEHAASAVRSMLQIQSNPRANEIKARVEKEYLNHLDVIREASLQLKIERGGS